MSDIKLFNINGTISEYQSGTVALEKELQNIIENNMQTFFGVTFLASEYRTTDGRMDSLGIDENHCPVIIEYKKSVNQNVINQGLFYLNWLLDHKDSFKVLVIEKLGLQAADNIDWTMPRVICIANDFTKYDESAIKQMNRNISLIRYKKFGNDMLMFEYVNENIAQAIADEDAAANGRSREKTFTEQYNTAKPEIKELYDDLRNYILSLSDDVSENNLKLYTAFRKIKNIVCAEILSGKILLYLRIEPSSVEYEENFSRDTSNIGHWGTGDVEVTVRNRNDFEKAKLLIDRAYNEN